MDLHVSFVLAAEGSADVRCDHPHPVFRYSERPGDLAPIAMRGLAGGMDDDRAVGLDQSHRPLRLQEGELKLDLHRR